MSFYVYILHCNDGSYYTGHTENLESRLIQHEQGMISNCYTYSRRPLSLMFSESFTTREEALRGEMQIKGWSRKKKQALIEGNWNLLKELSVSYGRCT